MRYLKASLSFLLFFSFLQLWSQFEIPEKPQKETSVYDYINLLPAGQRVSLEQKLITYSDSTSTQIVIAIIGSTEGENINYLGAQWGHKWGIGQSGKDNGILILLARDDRQIAINTGYGVEGSLTDAMSKRIIENIIIPEFKKGDYYSGLNLGADAIFKVLTGEFKEDRTFNNGNSSPLPAFLPFIIFAIILIILWSRKDGNNNGRGGGKRGLSPWDVIILSNMGRSGSSGGGFSGGSFGGGGFSGGFGGGGFGGGGASGGW
ncbi:TPM domain-containing protein [Maribacter sp. MMG018]|uniref:TPM domain-containing protein n=1 Tax=Maribacter sp. MMG018 TaxID=2822688 RepID=UPI001B38D0FB|nr:TPM domain-containing protein [Maribacter sp. MMG018]MBQ4915817.1 TPM domain-containing protein [Maribacter sp. MMG018]